MERTDETAHIVNNERFRKNAKDAKLVWCALTQEKQKTKPNESLVAAGNIWRTKGSWQTRGEEAIGKHMKARCVEGSEETAEEDSGIIDVSEI